MKAKVKTTGQIVDVKIHGMKADGTPISSILLMVGIISKLKSWNLNQRNMRHKTNGIVYTKPLKYFVKE